MLRVRAHGPARDENHHARDEIPLGPAVALARQPDAQQARAPPHDAHARVLQVVAAPGLAPAVLGEGVDAAPGRDHEAVEELLAASGAPQPELADEQQDGEHDAVPDEGGAHDVVRETLSQMVPAAVAHGGYPAEEHLHPAHHRHELSYHAVRLDDVGSDCGVEALGQVQLQVDTDEDLQGEHEAEGVGEGGVDVGRELAAAVLVAEEVGKKGEERAGGLDGDVPS